MLTKFLPRRGDLFLRVRYIAQLSVFCIPTWVVAAPNQLFEPATSNQHFTQGIDFWGDGKDSIIRETENVKPATVAPPVVDKEVPQKSNEESFSWNQYLDPKSKEFFKEGDYTPPAPFMEVVRNPNDENIKNWFTFINKKNELLKQFQVRLSEYTQKNPKNLASADQAFLSKVAQTASPQEGPVDPKRYRLRMYFDSHCPHCKKMFQTLLDLKERGFFVEAKQVDSGPLENYPIYISRASQGELKTKDIQSVPLLFVGDLKKKVVYRMPGYQSTRDLLVRLKGKETS